MVDSRQPRFGQAITGSTTLLGFVLGWPVVMPVIGVVLGLASIFGASGNVYVPLYRGFKRLARLGPPKQVEEAWPPRFANICGFALLGAATLAYFALDLRTLAWTLDLIVAALALLGAVTGLCVGCEIYALGRRIGTRGRVRGILRVPAERVAGGA